MKLNIPYGDGEITLRIPDENILHVVQDAAGGSRRDEKDIILDALSHPINSPGLAELARGKKSAVLLVSDYTRPCPSYKFLPYLIDSLEEAGVNDLKVIFGLGIHRKHTDAEKRKLVGDEVCRRVSRIIDLDDQRCRLIGTTTAGTPVEVFEEALSAELLIATGNLEYHYFAGYSGGAKAVLPGICSRRSLQANHRMMLDDRAVAGNFKDNPVRMDIEEAGAMAKIDFLFNVITDDDKRIVTAFSGRNNDAFLHGFGVYDRIHKREIDRKVDMVITSPGGHPKDVNLYQAQKALDNVKNIVKEGGEIILVASCPEKCGEKTFEDWMVDARDYQKLYARIRENFIVGGHKAVAISKMLTKVRISLYSSFNPRETEGLGFIKIHDLQQYLDQKIASDNDAKIVAVLNGRLVQFKGETR